MVQICVVVATFGRSALLPRLVAALEAQVGAPPFEAVLVDDASRDDSWPLLQRLAATRPWLRVLRQPRNAGPATARNVGWRATDAPWLAFTDDDCVPAPGWLAALAVGLHQADLVQGRTLPNPDQLAACGPFSRTLRVEAPDGLFQTCNLGVRRATLQRTEGFDERFRHAAGEDTELAWRAIESGARTAFAAGALVHHDVRPSSLRAALADTPRWGSVVLAVSTHPGLREKVHSRWFWRASHPPAMLAVLALAVAAGTRRAAALTLLAPYARHRLRVDPLPSTGPRRRLALLPAALLLDATEVGVLAVASARHRTLLL